MSTRCRQACEGGYEERFAGRRANICTSEYEIPDPGPSLQNGSSRGGVPPCLAPC
jgi:hypothetical protein